MDGLEGYYLADDSTEKDLSVSRGRRERRENTYSNGSHPCIRIVASGRCYFKRI